MLCTLGVILLHRQDQTATSITGMMSLKLMAGMLGLNSGMLTLATGTLNCTTATLILNDAKLNCTTIMLNLRIPHIQ